ncbi:MAG: hypothetical protein AAF449_11665, partial [Myxococcota bacterium]
LDLFWLQNCAGRDLRILISAFDLVVKDGSDEASAPTGRYARAGPTDVCRGLRAYAAPSDFGTLG